MWDEAATTALFFSASPHTKTRSKILHWTEHALNDAACLSRLPSYCWKVRWRFLKRSPCWCCLLLLNLLGELKWTMFTSRLWFMQRLSVIIVTIFRLLYKIGTDCYTLVLKCFSYILYCKRCRSAPY